ncbi:exodeoxyribonuclease III [Acetobacteraceae bacterium]|nr:exodeoxyribonuclease III [Acetobacteraceae bacterium]
MTKSISSPPLPKHLRILTWNINSLRLRLPLLEKIVQEKNPDIICLQETKVTDALFPLEGVQKIGFEHCLFKGMKSYNGVAILSKYPLTLLDDFPEWQGLQDCRHIAARLESSTGHIDLHNFYVPAGGDIPDPEENPKFAHKLGFLEEAKEWFAKNPPKRAVLMGDLNVAPLPDDVWSHKQLLKIVSHTPEETERCHLWQQEGFIDAMRTLHPEPEKLFTWWSYRNKDWKKSNRGRRLDHLWITPDLRESLASLEIMKEARDFERPSDHVPCFIDLELK